MDEKETADLSARRLRLLGNIKAFAIIQRPEASQEILVTESKE